MGQEHEIVAQVYAAREDRELADAFIRDYIPFIRKEAAKFLARPCSEQDDEYSIALMAFHEAMLGYERGKGAFLKYAALTIRSRLIDCRRRESRHQGHISIYEGGEDGEEGQSLADRLTDGKDCYEESAGLEATRQEIAELSAVMASFGISLTDVADNSPRQDRTLDACGRAVRYAAANPALLDELLRTKKLPLSALAAGAGVERKTLERHRRYVLAMLLIQTNGYEIIRGHIRHVLRPKGGVKM